jgi:hypothetical protein
MHPGQVGGGVGGLMHFGQVGEGVLEVAGEEKQNS